MPDDGQYPRVSPPTAHTSLSVPAIPVELVKLELPCLDSDYTSRDAFICEVIELLNELQEVRGRHAHIHKSSLYTLDLELTKHRTKV